MPHSLLHRLLLHLPLLALPSAADHIDPEAHTRGIGAGLFFIYSAICFAAIILYVAWDVLITQYGPRTCRIHGTPLIELSDFERAKLHEGAMKEYEGGEDGFEREPLWGEKVYPPGTRGRGDSDAAGDEGALIRWES